MVNVEYINPFLKSVDNMMGTMMNVMPERASPFVKENGLTSGDVSGVIGFADINCKGTVILSFPVRTALNIYEALMGESVSRISSKVQDAIGEMANIVAGGAKAEFAESGLSFHLSIPTVILGQDHRINQNIDEPVIVVPMKFNSHPFTLEVCMKITRTKNK